jgi:hypothetical protein
MSFFTTSALIIVEPKISRNPCQYTTMHPEISVILKSARDSPRPPGAGRGRPSTGNNARRIGILFKSIFLSKL